MNAAQLLIARLRDYLRRTNTTQAALARAAGVSPVYLNRVLNGRATPTLTTAQQLAAAAGLTIRIDPTKPIR